MKVLVACEYSGRVREAFRKLGHDAWSCDLLKSEDNSQYHFLDDALDVAYSLPWDLMIAHPPCTFMSNSGAKHLYLGGKKVNGINKNRWDQLEQAAQFFKKLLNAPIPKIAIENPIMLSYAKNIIGMTQTQTIQPWMFGHGETKATCLWLKNLPKLIPTNRVEGREQNIWLCKGKAKGEPVWKFRSRTYQGIANAMAEQWGI